MIQPRHELWSALDRAYSDLIAKKASEVSLRLLCRELFGLRESLTPREWSAVRETCQTHPVFDVLLEEPITHRAYGKPRGYAGDATLMDLIYSIQPAAGMSTLGERVHSFIKGRPGTRGARARKLKLAALLHRTLGEVETPEILSVACGHMRETQLLSPQRLGRAERIVAFDQDEASLSEVSRSLRGCDPLSVVPGSIRSLIAGELDLGDFDLIYSLGLYDYLDQDVAQRLTQVLFDALKPGGQLVVANFLPMEDSAYMEAFMEWSLVYRTQHEIMDMAAALEGRDVKQKRFTAEHTNTVGFLELSKADGRSLAA